MAKVLFPGSFDPVTNGHLDIIKTLANSFEQVIVLVSQNIDKKASFTVDNRISFINKALDLLNLNNVKVDSNDGLTVEYAIKNNIHLIAKGVRNSDDYISESVQADVNRQIGNIETVFIPAKPQFISISSSMVKQLYKYDHDVSQFCPTSVDWTQLY